MSPQTVKRILAVGFTLFTDPHGVLRCGDRGQEIEISPVEETRLEWKGLLLPTTRPERGHSNANRPGASDMVELAKAFVARGEPDKLELVLKAERLAPEEARAAVIEPVRALIEAHSGDRRVIA